MPGFLGCISMGSNAPGYTCINVAQIGNVGSQAYFAMHAGYLTRQWKPYCCIPYRPCLADTYCVSGIS